MTASIASEPKRKIRKKLINKLKKIRIFSLSIQNDRVINSINYRSFPEIAEG